MHERAAVEKNRHSNDAHTRGKVAVRLEESRKEKENMGKRKDASHQVSV